MPYVDQVNYIARTLHYSAGQAKKIHDIGQYHNIQHALDMLQIIDTRLHEHEVAKSSIADTLQAMIHNHDS